MANELRDSVVEHGVRNITYNNYSIPPERFSLLSEKQRKLIVSLLARIVELESEIIGCKQAKEIETQSSSVSSYLQLNQLLQTSPLSLGNSLFTNQEVFNEPSEFTPRKKCLSEPAVCSLDIQETSQNSSQDTYRKCETSNSTQLALVSHAIQNPNPAENAACFKQSNRKKHKKPQYPWRSIGNARGNKPQRFSASFPTYLRLYSNYSPTFADLRTGGLKLMQKVVNLTDRPPVRVRKKGR